MKYTVTLPLSPSANRYWRSVRGRVVVSAEAQAYKAEVGWLLKEQGVTEPIVGPVALTLRVYRARRSGDLDNYVKICADSLSGILYGDDSQIVALHAFRNDDKANPRIELEAWEVGA